MNSVKKFNIDNYIFGYVDGNNILFRGKDSSGKDIQCIIDDYAPTLYTETKTPTDYKGFYGQNLKSHNFETISEYRSWIKQMGEYNVPVHGVISPEINFFRELPKTKPILSSDMTWMMYDIETTVTPGVTVQESAEQAKESVTLISTLDNKTNKVHIFYYTQIDLEEVESYQDDIAKKYQVEYHFYNNEKEMLLGFLEYYEEINPHLLSGWNTSGFDNVFMFNRLNRLFGEKTALRLSPFRKVKKKTITVYGKDSQRYRFIGVADFDYLEIYRQYVYENVPNYRLDTVAEHHLGARKLKHDGSFEDFYTNHWNKFVAYNIRDTILVAEIDKVVDVISVACTVAYQCGVTMDDTFGTIKKLDALTYQYACDEGIIIPPQSRVDSESYEGGYVSEAKVGKHKALASVDAASLYPNTIRENNISPETQVPYHLLPESIQKICDEITSEKLFNREIDLSALRGTTLTVTPAGACYDTSKVGLVSKIMGNLYDGRKIAKKKAQTHEKNVMAIKEQLKESKDPELLKQLREEERLCTIYSNLQMAMKILLNSYYGAYGNNNFRYYSLDHARSITLSGQALIRHITEEANKWLKSKFKTDFDFQVYNDTDSVVGDSLVSTTQGNIKIEDMFNLAGELEIRGAENYVKHLNSNIYAHSVNTETGLLESKLVKYVMKHKVSKRMFKIKSGDDSVIVTEDHSLMVNRNGDIIDVKPLDVISGDKIIKIHHEKLMNITNDFEIEDLGICEEWVYDIEVEDNHNFFANNICVHNSVYFSLQPLFEHTKIDPEKDYEKALELLTKFVDGPLSNEIQRISDEYASYRNLPCSMIEMKREAISVRGGFWVAKKKYAIMVDDMEGVVYKKDEPYMKAMGLELSKAGKFSEEIRGKLSEIMTLIFTGTEKQVQQLIADYRTEFMKKPMTEIGFLTNVNEVDKWLDSTGNLKTGTPIGPKAIVNHNRYLDGVGDTVVARLSAGDKIYYAPLRKNNPLGFDVIGYIDWTGALLDIDNWVDRVALWEKNFISPADTMLSAVGWTPTKKNKLF